jgi:hypothetical protein
LTEKDLTSKKEAIKKFDPALTMIAVNELLQTKKTEQASVEKEDVEKVKPKIKEVFSSLPESKDRAAIISKALYEVNSEIITEEIKKIKTSLSSLDQKELMEIAKELATSTPECTSCLLPELGCGDCIHYFVVACTPQYCVGQNIIQCSACITYPIIHCTACITYSICSNCVSHRVCSVLLNCQTYKIYCNVCIRYAILVQGAQAEPILDEAQKLNAQEIDSTMKEKIVDAVVEDPKLSKAVRKLILEMKSKGEL